MRTTLIIICLYFFIALFMTDARLLAEGEKMSEEITILMVPETESVEYGEHIPVKMTLKNNTKYIIDFLFNYSNPRGIEFKTRDAKKAYNKPRHFSPSIEEFPITIDAGSIHSVTFYLDKFIDFKQAGDFMVDYNVEINYYLKDEGLTPKSIKKAKTQGSMQIKLRESLAE